MFDKYRNFPSIFEKVLATQATVLQNFPLLKSPRNEVGIFLVLFQKIPNVRLNENPHSRNVGWITPEPGVLRDFLSVPEEAFTTRVTPLPITPHYGPFSELSVFFAELFCCKLCSNSLEWETVWFSTFRD